MSSILHRSTSHCHWVYVQYMMWSHFLSWKLLILYSYYSCKLMSFVWNFTLWIHVTWGPHVFNLPWLLYLCFLCPFPRGILSLLEETECIKGRVSLSSVTGISLHCLGLRLLFLCLLARFISPEVGLTAVNSDICLGVGSSALPKQMQKTGGCVVKKQAWESIKVASAELEPPF